MANFCFQLAYKNVYRNREKRSQECWCGHKKEQGTCVGAAPFVNFNPLSMPTYSFLWPRQTLLLPLTYSTKVDRQ
jgi:hypothetical protein